MFSHPKILLIVWSCFLNFYSTIEFNPYLPFEFLIFYSTIEFNRYLPFEFLIF